MGRYGYAAFFAVMGGGVSAGIAGVLIGSFYEDDPGWGPLVSGLVGLALAALIFVTVLRATRTH